MSNNEWLQISQQLHDELNMIKRDALVPYVISEEAEVNNERELYEQLLIDVEMGSCGKASKVGEAIAAAQLYLHRYFVNLEPGAAKNPEAVKHKLKTYWQWMKNYRVWEANRKVFLYPENYIRPELRDTKTPAFKALEDDLLQGEITEDAAQRAYQKYLDEYTEVSRLTIAGGYVYDSVDANNNAAKSLVLFGRTKTDPRRYYYRTAQFLGTGKATTWGSWLNVNTQIDADKVYPVFAFNRVFVFWVKIETIADTPSSTTLTTTESSSASGGKTQTVASQSQSATCILRIYYSFYNLNKEWVPAQTFRPKDAKAETVDIKIPSGVAISDVKNIGLLVETSDKLSIPGSISTGDHENIIIQCTYQVPVTEYDVGLTPASPRTTLPANGERLFAIGRDDQEKLYFRIFDHQENQKIDIEIKPSDLSADKKTQLVELTAKLLPYWISNPLTIPSESKKSIIDTVTAITGYTPLRPKAGEPQSIVCHRTFSLTPELYTTKLLRQTPFENTGQSIFKSIFDESDISVDQMVMFNTIWSTSEGSWFSFDYKGGSFLCKPDAAILASDLWPKLIPGNADSLPEWPKIEGTGPSPDRNAKIDAAVQLPSRKIVFFKNDKNNWGRGVPQTYTTADAFPGNFSAERNIRDDWGKVNNNIAKTGLVNAAYVDRINQKTYLFSGNQYFVYSNGPVQSYVWVDEGYPQPIAANPNLPQWNQVDAVFQGKDQKTYFFNNTTKKYRVAGTTDEKDTKTDWGTVTKSSFIKDFRPPADDPDAPAVDAAFVVGTGTTATTYLIHRFQYIKYTTGAYYSVITGEPKPHDFLELLIELGFDANNKTAAEKTALRDERVVASHNKGADVYFYTKAGNSYEYKGGQLTLGAANKTVWSAGFELNGVIYQFAGSKLTATTATTNAKEEATVASYINAALAGADTDDKIYLFRAAEYITVPKAGLSVQGLVAAIAAWSGQRSEDKWGKMGDNIARTGTIDAAFCDGDRTYLFSGDEYVTYSGSAYASPQHDGYPDAGYPKKIKTNDERFPKWDKMDAILQTFTEGGGKGDLYFFNNTDQTYVSSSNLRRKPQTRDKWGRVRNNIAEQGIVDAAFVKEGCLFLTSGNQIFRYTLLTSGQNGEFVDAGYPKQFNWGRSQIDAAFTLGNKTYLFEGGFYCRLKDLQNKELQELTTPPTFKAMHGNWGSLPKDLKSGLDAALTTAADGGSQDLFLIQGDRYIKYHILDETSPQPFELEEIPYEIVRLTTSTAYRLNQELFAGGLPALLSLNTQEIDETPAFSLAATIPLVSVATTIKVKPGKVKPGKLPSGSHLDFSSANGLYYWEIFFHAPFLIAQALNLGQQFEAAKTWYEYIYDPTGTAPYWKFLPFVATDMPTFAGVDEALIDAYLSDPFDPHAIAALRPIAYRKAIVMAYLDNLIDWGDMLFQQYTRESINEARMLYILAYDLLGAKPENLGQRQLSADQPYAQLQADSGPQRSNQLVSQQMNPPTDIGAAQIQPSLKTLVEGDRDYDFLVYPTEIPGGITPHTTVPNPYFFVPENTVLLDYWERVEDRLYKIRHCLNMMGISQPLPLFEPPIDPMALVRAVSAGASLSSALVSLNISVPHYRFSFMVRKAQELAQKLSQFGNDLLGALEKHDAETLSLLQNRQEGEILAMTRGIKAAQLQEAIHSREALEESLKAANDQAKHYERLINTGLTQSERAQLNLMITAAAFMTASGMIKLSAAIVRGLPQTTIGLFSFGMTIGGEELGETIDKLAEALESSGDGISMVGEAIGIKAQHERSVEDWTLQKLMAESESRQITLQIKGAVLQEAMAQREINILEKQIEHNASISTYMRDKFSNAQLYQWMASKLSGLYYQTYQMAFDMAKAAEKSFQFERGMPESEVSFISGPYWDSQRKGLLAGDSLGVDLDRMEKAYIDSNRRGFEITKAISLLDLDPVALLQLKTKSVCEFSLLESLFDYDFPGHYCRQIRTLSLSFDFGEAGQTVMATLTQLNHKTVLEPDPKAVKFLLDPKDQPPLSLRNDWKANQQIALSHVEEGEKNNGLFELRFDDERYLPFENTGAVSTWRLELNGRKNAYNINVLRDVIINLKYTAEQGGQVFAGAVKGLLKPYPTARFLDVAQEFPDEWQDFVEGDGNELVLPMSRDLFPNMSSSKITGIFARYELAEPAAVSLVLNGDKTLTLKDGKFLLTNGLSIGSRGSEWRLTVNGDKDLIDNIGLVFGYKASVT